MSKIIVAFDSLISFNEAAAYVVETAIGMQNEEAAVAEHLAREVSVAGRSGGLV